DWIGLVQSIDRLRYSVCHHVVLGPEGVIFVSHTGSCEVRSGRPPGRLLLCHCGMGTHVLKCHPLFAHLWSSPIVYGALECALGERPDEPGKGGGCRARIRRLCRCRLPRRSQHRGELSIRRFIRLAVHGDDVGIYRALLRHRQTLWYDGVQDGYVRQQCPRAVPWFPGVVRSSIRANITAHHGIGAIYWMCHCRRVSLALPFIAISVACHRRDLPQSDSRLYDLPGLSVFGRTALCADGPRRSHGCRRSRIGAESEPTIICLRPVLDKAQVAQGIPRQTFQLAPGNVAARSRDQSNHSFKIIEPRTLMGNVAYPSFP